MGKNLYENFLIEFIVYNIAFFSEPRYGVQHEDVLIITWRENNTSCLITISGNRGNWDNLDTAIEEILCLFYTDMGEIHGPCLDYRKIKHEWT